MNRLLTVFFIAFLLALFCSCEAKADDTARAELHIPAGFAITYGSHLFWNKAIGLDNKYFAIGWGVISTVIIGAAWEAGGDGRVSDHHLATAMGFNLLGAGLAIIPILFDNTGCVVEPKGVRIPMSIFDK
jgi:hypothetical protein